MATSVDAEEEDGGGVKAEEDGDEEVPAPAEPAGRKCPPVWQWPCLAVRYTAIAINLLGLFIFVILVAVVCLACCLVCSPCILFLRCTNQRLVGRTVSLDGTKPPGLAEETRTDIERAQQAMFRARVGGSFLSDLGVPGLGRGLRVVPDPSLPLGRSISQVVHFGNDDPVAIEGGQEDGVGGSGGGPAVVGPATAPGGSVEPRRDKLISTRRAAFEKSAKNRRAPRLPGYLQIKVEREHIVRQSLQCLNSAPVMDLLAKHLIVKFEGEQGMDAGGLRRDWFDCLGRRLVEAAERGDGHFMVLPDKTLAPRPFETRLTEMYAVGRLAGLAVWFGIALPIPLGSVACKWLLDESISPTDLQRLDPEFFQFRVTPVLQPGGVAHMEAALGEPLTFMSAATALRPEKQLCPDGAEKKVTEENKQEYIKMLCEHYLCGDMEEQIKFFLRGFWDIFPKEELVGAGLTYRELALLISGYDALDPAQWRLHTVVNSTGCDEVLQWFWEMVGEMSSEEHAKLLHFATGSSRLPSTSFAGITPSFNISVSGEDDHVPSAHTCGNQLVIPKYTSKETLVEKMRIALANDEGFGFI